MRTDLGHGLDDQGITMGMDFLATCFSVPLPQPVNYVKVYFNHVGWICLRNTTCSIFRLGKMEHHPCKATYPALVLSTDFRPLSYFPSLWTWQTQ